MIDLGIVKPGSTVYIPFATYDSNDPSASVTITGLAVTDIEVLKNLGTTQRASDSGYALVDTDGIDIDGVTGIHGFTIDLSDNTTAGFWAAGAHYTVVVASITVDAATINFIPVTFRIGYPDALLNTTIATLATQTSFTLTDGPAEDDALNGCVVCIHDVASAVQLGFAVISDYTGSTKTVTLAAGVTFTAAATDNISIFPPANAAWGGAVAYTATRGLAGTALPAAAADAAGGLPISDAGGLDLDARLDAAVTSRLAPTTAGRTLDVTATGAAGIDWGNVENPTTTVGLSGTTVGVVTTNTDMRGTDSAATASALSTHDGKLDTLTTTVGAAGAGLTEAGGTGDHLTAVPDTAGTTTLLSRIPSALFSGITSLAQWLGLIAGKQTPNATALTEIKATGAGSGTYDATTDSLEAVRDRGDSAWITATGFSTLDAAGVRTAVGLASANLDTQLGDIPTVSEFNARTLVAAAYFDPAADAVANVTLVDTVTTNTDMRGTDSAALASVATEARLAELDAANLPAVTDAIKAITDAIGATAAANLARTLGAAGVVFFTAETGTLSTTVATTDLTETTDDHYIGRTIIWLTGVLAGQATDITDYSGTNGTLTFTALTEAPSNGDTGIIV